MNTRTFVAISTFISPSGSVRRRRLTSRLSDRRPRRRRCNGAPGTMTFSGHNMTNLPTTLVALASACLLSHGALAQDPAPRSNPVGVWRGTSKCMVRPSACNDEIVVYRIVRVNATDSLTIDGRRIANGQEVEMGVLGCHSAESGAQVTCAMPNGVWRFTIRGDSLVGDLRSPDNKKTRDVRTARSR